MSQVLSRPAGAAAKAPAEVPAVRRASALLWHLARHADPAGLPLSRLARDLGMQPSTALRILRELAATRLVAIDRATKHYRLGSGVLSLARAVTRQDRFVQLAQPHLHRLSRTFEVGASAQIREGDDDLVVVAATTVVPGDMVTPGGRTPLFTSASGRLMAAFGEYAENELRERFNRVRWQDPPKFNDWREEVKNARSSGLAVDEGLFRKGITAIAAAIPGPSGTVDSTVSITIVSAQLDPRMRTRIAAEVKRAATEISQALR